MQGEEKRSGKGEGSIVKNNTVSRTSATRGNNVHIFKPPFHFRFPNIFANHLSKINFDVHICLLVVILNIHYSCSR